MTVELVLLAILLAPWLVTLALVRKPGDPRVRLAGRLGLALAFAAFASAHFLSADSLATMLPPWAPEPGRVIFITGVMEGLIALGLLAPWTRRYAGLAAILVLVCFFPANVYAAVTRADVIGHVQGPAYLLVRAPLQVLLIGWAWWFAVRRG